MSLRSPVTKGKNRQQTCLPRFLAHFLQLLRCGFQTERHVFQNRANDSRVLAQERLEVILRYGDELRPRRGDGDGRGSRLVEEHGHFAEVVDRPEGSDGVAVVLDRDRSREDVEHLAAGVALLKENRIHIVGLYEFCQKGTPLLGNACASKKETAHQERVAPANVGHHFAAKEDHQEGIVNPDGENEDGFERSEGITKVRIDPQDHHKDRPYNNEEDGRYEGADDKFPFCELDRAEDEEEEADKEE